MLRFFRTAKNWIHVFTRLVFYFFISLFGFLVGRRQICLWAMRNWFIGSCRGLGIQSVIRQKENLQIHKQAVFIANHISSLDIFIIGAHLEHDYRWLAKASLFKAPLIGWHLSIAGHIPVYRGKNRQRNKELKDRIHKVVEQGASLFFFPEGTRSTDGKLKKFKKGAFVYALQENLPIVPLVLRGTGNLTKNEVWDLDDDKSKVCSVTVLPPVEIDDFIESPLPSSVEDKKENAVERLKQHCHDIFQKHLQMEPP